MMASSNLPGTNLPQDSSSSNVCLITALGMWGTSSPGPRVPQVTQSSALPKLLPGAEAFVQFILLNLYTVLESALIPSCSLLPQDWGKGGSETSRNAARGNSQKAEKPKCPWMGE